MATKIIVNGKLTVHLINPSMYHNLHQVQEGPLPDFEEDFGGGNFYCCDCDCSGGKIKSNPTS